MQPDYKGKSIYKGFTNAYKNNVDDTPRAAIEGELNKKILNFCNLHGFSKKEVITNICNNKIVAALFAKNPNKQNFYEKTAGSYIKNLSGIYDFKGTYLKNQKDITVSDEIKIDFEWKYEDRTFFAQHTHTLESGGSQSRQYKELKNFINAANLIATPNTFFIAIADGAYYEQQDSGQVNISRLEVLVNLSNNSTVFACNIVDLEMVMKDICIS